MYNQSGITCIWILVFTSTLCFLQASRFFIATTSTTKISPVVQAFQNEKQHRLKTIRNLSLFLSSSTSKKILKSKFSAEDDQQNDSIKGSSNFGNEETLLRIRLNVKETKNYDCTTTTMLPSSTIVNDITDNIVAADDEAKSVALLEVIEIVSLYCQTYPYAVVLPVQPLRYMPTKRPTLIDPTACIEIAFLRKKTPEKSSVDGGIIFFVEPVGFSPEKLTSEKSSTDNTINDDKDLEEDDDEDDDEDDYDKKTSASNPNSNMMIEIIAKRNSNGQTISKMFAEKLIITSFVSSLVQQLDNSKQEQATTKNDSSTTTTSKPVVGSNVRLTDHIDSIQSIYHKWMSG